MRIKELWDAAIKEKTDRGVERARAVREVVREQPDLHRLYVYVANHQKPEPGRKDV